MTEKAAWTGWKELMRKWKAHRELVQSIPLRSGEEKRKEKVRLARGFVLVALVCGMLLTFFLPPFNAPDETAHFINAYAMSQGNLIPEEYEGQLVRMVPAYYKKYTDQYPGTMKGAYNPGRYYYWDMYRESKDWESHVDNTLVPVDNAITSTGYIFSAAAMKIGTALTNLLIIREGVYPYNQELMGRIGNLLFYILVIYFAIMRAPHFNKTILLIGLMPMSLFQGASLSYDAVLIPVSLYFCALILDLHSEPEKTISTPDILKVMMCVFLIAGIKFGAYIPLAALLLTVPKTKYGSTKRMILCIAGVIISAFIGYLPTIIANSKAAALGAVYGATTKAPEQKEWVLSNLGSMPHLFLYTIIMRRYTYIYGFWGELGWLDTSFPIPMMIMGYVILMTVTISETASYTLWERKRWKNLFSLAGGLISMIGIMLGMYFYCTADAVGIGVPIIEGVQGRYFIPLFMWFVLAVSNPGLLRFALFRTGKADRVLAHISLLWGICCSVMTVAIVLLRYWLG